MDFLKKFIIVLILSIMINKINGASIAQSGSESMTSTAEPTKDQYHVPMDDTKLVITVLPNDGINKEADQITKTVDTPFVQLVLKQIQTNETISNVSTSTESSDTHKPTPSFSADSHSGAQGLIPAATETPTIKEPYPTDIHKQGQIIIR